MIRVVNILAALAIFFAGRALGQQPGYIHITDKQFRDANGRDFYPLIMNTKMDIVHPGGTLSGTPLLTYSLQYDEDEGLDCFNQEDCDRDILAQFNRIKAMGFNGIRVMGISPRFATNYRNLFTSRRFTGFTLATQTNNPWKEYFVPIQRPYNQSPQADFLIKQYEKILQLAAQVPQPFYVVFNLLNYYSQDVVTHRPYDIQVISPYYAEFLDVVASRLCSYPNLLAYDLFNEPMYFEQMDLAKEDACQLVNLWTYVIKRHCNQLVTLNNIWNDMYEWGPASMNIDFYSVHFYPDRREELFSSQEALEISLERFRCMANWYKHNCPMPWIIGETGFSCIAGSDYPVVHGDMEQQETWAKQTLDISRNSGASGYSWWFDQETCWNTYEDGFGLLYHGKRFTDPPSRLNEKDAVQVFRKYLKNDLAPKPVPPDLPPVKFSDILKCE
jgi:hypothetical protein